MAASGLTYIELHCHSAYSFLDGASRSGRAGGDRGRARPRGARADRPRQRLRGDGVRAGLRGRRGAPDHRLRADGGGAAADAAPGPPHAAGRGRDGLGEPLPADHRGPSGHARASIKRVALSRTLASDGSRCRPRCRSTSSSGTPRGSSASPAARATGRSPGRWERGDPAGAADLARRLLRAFGRERFRIELQRPLWRHDRARNRWLAALAERLGVPCVATGNVHAHERLAPRLQDAFVAVRLRATLDESEPAAARQLSLRCSLSPAAMAARAFATTRRRSPRPRGWPSGCASTSPATSATAIPAPRTAAPTAGWPSSAGRGWTSATRGRRSAPRRERRLEEELARDPRARLSGFFLLHQRHARAGARGGRRGARAGLRATAAAAGPRPRLQRQLDRLLPDRPLARRPGRERALPRALPERGDHRAAGHRPRLPARHPREADPARARALRARALGARRRLRDLPRARCDPRPRQGARAAAGRDRAGRARRRRLRGEPGCLGAASRRRWAGAGALAPLAGAGRAAAARRGAAAPPLPAPRRDGDLDPAADRPLPGAAGGDGGPPDRAVGQGLVRRRRLPEDRPARAGDALGGRALRRGDRARARRADRPLADPARRRPRSTSAIQRGGDDRRLPDREPRADADAAAHAAARTSTT